MLRPNVKWILIRTRPIALTHVLLAISNWQTDRRTDQQMERPTDKAAYSCVQATKKSKFCKQLLYDFWSPFVTYWSLYLRLCYYVLHCICAPLTCIHPVHISYNATLSFSRQCVRYNMHICAFFPMSKVYSRLWEASLPVNWTVRWSILYRPSISLQESFLYKYSPLNITPPSLWHSWT